MLRTREEARALIEKIEQKVQEGLSIKAACAAIGLKDSYYHSWRRRHKGKSFKKKAVPTLLSLPHSPFSILFHRKQAHGLSRKSSRYPPDFRSTHYPEQSFLMNKNEILQCFLNVSMSNGHDGLASLAKKHEIDIRKLEPGQYIVFINGARDKVKVYAASNVVAYLKLGRGDKLNLSAIQEIPKAFRGSGRIDYDAALKESVTKALEKKGKTNDLQVYTAMK